MPQRQRSSLVNCRPEVRILLGAQKQIAEERRGRYMSTFVIVVMGIAIVAIGVFALLLLFSRKGGAR